MQDPDPTNLYLANLSPYMGESDLEAMLQPYGHVVSTRVLRDIQQKSRGVGFARMETRDVCEKVIEVLNGKILAGTYCECSRCTGERTVARVEQWLKNLTAEQPF